MSIDELVIAHGHLLASLGAKVSRINATLGIPDPGVESKPCPVCRKPVPVNGDGALPPHQIDGAVLIPGRRHSLSVCRYRPQEVAS